MVVGPFGSCLSPLLDPLGHAPGLDQAAPATFFCGGSRNFSKFIDLFDGVFVLEADRDALNRRLDERPDDEWGGGKPVERDRIARWHETKDDVPKDGIPIDATAPIAHVVAIVWACGLEKPAAAKMRSE